MKYILFGILLLLASAAFYLTQNAQSQKPSQDQNPDRTVQNTPDDQKIENFATNLDTPWEAVRLPDKSLLVTERAGQVKKITTDGTVQAIGTISNAKEIGEGGLLGMALHPNFPTNNFIYFYYTYASAGENTKNRVERYVLIDNKLKSDKIIIDNIPGASNHNGGRLAFGPDNFLYITTGDAAQPSLAQDINSIAGKILRVTDDGSPAPQNPFNNAVYSYGHRNPQGLAWRNNELWSVEHGPLGNDELNKIEEGKNYGWPEIRGDQSRNNMQNPIIHSGFGTWAPGSLIYLNNLFYFTGLRGSKLYSFDPENSENGLKEYFQNTYGRLRVILKDDNESMIIGTSNLDGRGSAQENDDKLLHIPLSQLTNR